MSTFIIATKRNPRNLGVSDLLEFCGIFCCFSEEIHSVFFLGC